MENLENNGKNTTEYVKELEQKLEQYKAKIIEQENEKDLLKQTLKSREKTIKKIEDKLAALLPATNKEIEKLTQKLENCTDEKEKNILISKIQELKEKRTQIQMQQIEKVIQELQIERNKTFSFSSEKSSRLLNETEIVAEEGFENTIKITKPKKQVAKRVAGKKEESLSKLERKVIEYKLEGEQKKCSECGRVMSVIGSSSRTELIEIPAKVIVVEHKTYVYKCNYCSRQLDKDVIVKAPSPKAWAERSSCTPELLSFIIHRKFACHLPYNRIEDMYADIGVTLKRQLMSQWVLNYGYLFVDIVKNLKRHLVSNNYLHADETIIQVLDEPGKSPSSKSYYWMYRTDKYEENPVIIFEYKDNRRKENPEEFLKGFNGYLNADGYASYKGIGGVTVCQCWAHARRKFTDLIDAKNKTYANQTVKEGFEYITKLYQVENDTKEMTIQDRFEYREKHATKILSEFLVWLKNNYIKTDTTKTNEAIQYCLNNWTELTNYLKDGRISFDNNLAENSIRPIVLGRKNYLFYKSVKGANISGDIYSVISTAQANNLNTQKYIELLLKETKKIQEHQESEFKSIEDLLPWTPQVKELCKRD